MVGRAHVDVDQMIDRVGVQRTRLAEQDNAGVDDQYVEHAARSDDVDHHLPIGAPP